MSDDDESQIDPALAAAMGFTGFGQTRESSNKRRKFNHVADTFVEGQEVKQREKEAREKGSGANSMTLGVRSKVTKAREENKKGGSEEELVGGDENASREYEAVPRAGEEPNKKGRTKIKAAAPSGLAVFLERAKSIPSVPPPAAIDPQVSASETPAASLPTQMGLSSSDSIINVPGLLKDMTQDQLSVYGRGVKNQNGDVVYFLPSFLEDPWKE